MSEDRSPSNDTSSPGLPNLEALRAWARETAEPFDLIERIVVYEPAPSLSTSCDSDDTETPPIRHLLAVEVLGLPEDPRTEIEDEELLRTLEHLRHMLAAKGDSWRVLLCPPVRSHMGVEGCEGWVLFDRHRIIGIDQGDELAAEARARRVALLSEAEREKYVARLEARERASSRAYRCDELIRRWNLFESQLSHCFVLGLPPYRLDESGTLVPVISAEPLTSTMREIAWQALFSVIRKDAPKRFESSPGKPTGILPSRKRHPALW